MSGPLIKNIIDMKHAKELPIAASHKPIGANAISVSPKNSAAAALLNRFKSGLTKGTCFQNVAKIPAELAELKRTMAPRNLLPDNFMFVHEEPIKHIK